MGVVQKARSVVSDPREFFRAAMSERGYGDAVRYYATILLVPLAARLLMPIITSGDAVGAIIDIGIFDVLSSAVSTYVLNMLLTFVFAGMVHAIAKLISGASGFDNTYRVVAYGLTPSVLLGWVPLVGVVASLYSLYLMVPGMKVAHKMTNFKAAVSVVLVPVILGIAEVALVLSLSPYINW